MFISDVCVNEAIYNYNSVRLNVIRREIVEADKVAIKVDMKQAIADMAKDFSLQQYQYFVGKNLH